MDLTKRQQEIFDFIRSYSEKNGYPPTVRDIGKAVGLASVLRRDPTKPRALELLDRATRSAGSAVQGAIDKVRPGGLPVVGAVAAGSPVLAEENIEEYVQVPQAAGGEEGEYVLKVRGDSMVDAGILEGDYVVVQRRDEARDGEIVVALVGDDEATVKRYFREKDHIRLQPENPAMEPILADDVQILGRVVGLFRSVS
jgi:repressor LexA